MAFMGSLSLVSLAGRPHIIINIEVNSIIISILSIIIFIHHFHIVKVKMIWISTSIIRFPGEFFPGGPPGMGFPPGGEDYDDQVYNYDVVMMMS